MFESHLEEQILNIVPPIYITPEFKEYLSNNCKKKPSFVKLLFSIIWQLLNIIIFYGTVVFDLYLLYCYIKDGDVVNLSLTILWLFLPTLIVLFYGLLSSFRDFIVNGEKFEFREFFNQGSAFLFLLLK